MDNVKAKLIDSLYALNVLTLLRKCQTGHNLDALIKAIKSARAEQPFEARQSFVETVLKCREHDIIRNALIDEHITVSIEDVDPGQISPYPWVGDIPHSVLHGSLAEAADYLSNANQDSALEGSTLAKIKAMATSSQLLSLLPILICPARYQRANRLLIPHTDEQGNPCSLEALFEGEGYLEDGNHRALAQLFAGRSFVRVFRLVFPQGYLFPGES